MNKSAPGDRTELCCFSLSPKFSVTHCHEHKVQNNRETRNNKLISTCHFDRISTYKYSIPSFVQATRPTWKETPQNTDSNLNRTRCDYNFDSSWKSNVYKRSIGGVGSMAWYSAENATRRQTLSPWLWTLQIWLVLQRFQQTVCHCYCHSEGSVAVKTFWRG